MIQITNDYLPDTRKIWAAGDSKIITISHALLKLLGVGKGDYVQFFMKKAEAPHTEVPPIVKEEPKVESTPTAMQPTPEEIKEDGSENQESRTEVPDMPL